VIFSGDFNLFVVYKWVRGSFYEISIDDL
jgi:hypothetical protein